MKDFRRAIAAKPRCKTTSVSLMELTDNTNPTEVEEPPVLEEEESRTELTETSFHAILRKSTGATMKLQGSLGSRSVLILVDSGSTHNFIATSLVHELHLPIQGISSFGVQIGNGDIIQCNKICKGVSVQSPGLQLTQDYYPFSIGGADLVLGIKWLASLNTVQANWNEMFMIFYLNGKRYNLQGVPSVTRTTASFHSYSMLTNSLGNPSLPPAIFTILQQFEAIFAEPTTLPPFRSHFHNIPLLPEAKPPNIRPCRYPHYQKSEI